MDYCILEGEPLAAQNAHVQQMSKDGPKINDFQGFTVTDIAKISVIYMRLLSNF